MGPREKGEFGTEELAWKSLFGMHWCNLMFAATQTCDLIKTRNIIKGTGQRVKRDGYIGKDLC